MIQYCQSCGAEAALSYKFCPRCGGTNFVGTAAKTSGVFSGAVSQPSASANTTRSTGSVMRYGSSWRRLAGYAIDQLIFASVLLPIDLIATALYEGSESSLEIASALFTVVLVWLYTALLESGKHQATLGKKLLGLRVVDMNGSQLSFGKATLRFFAKTLSFITVIGMLMIFFTARKQGLHDKIAGTVVLHAGE